MKGYFGPRGCGKTTKMISEIVKILSTDDDTKVFLVTNNFFDLSSLKNKKIKNFLILQKNNKRLIIIKYSDFTKFSEKIRGMDPTSIKIFIDEINLFLSYLFNCSPNLISYITGTGIIENYFKESDFI